VLDAYVSCCLLFRGVSCVICSFGVGIAVLVAYVSCCLLFCCI
jgi:hypothetical protein